MNEKIAVNLKTTRQMLNLSRKSVASTIGISASTLADYENGHSMPSVKSLMALAKLYGCSTDHLLGIENIQPKIVLDVSGLSNEKIKLLQQLIDYMR